MTKKTILAAAMATLISSGLATAALAVNPCAPKQPNPCAPQTAKPVIDPKLVTRPAGTKLAAGDHAALVKDGEKLFKDTNLSTNGMACESCHADNNAFMPTFAEPYPHAVAMAAEKGDVTQVRLDEMVQFCMAAPMEAKPLPWASRKLAALTAYTAERQKAFQAQYAGKVNPCAPRR